MAMFWTSSTRAISATVAVVAGCACACAGQPEGAGAGATSVGATSAGVTSTSVVGTSATAPSAAVTPTAGGSTGAPAFGVVPTTRVPLEPKAQTCEEPERAPGSQRIGFVVGNRPGTPIVDILAPDDWTSAPRPDEPTLDLAGPDGLRGSVTVAPTDLEPGAAFDEYADRAMAHAPIASVSVLPAELCGYSGQKLLGTWSGSGGAPVQYRDRLAHVWTNSASYLVAIHLEGPGGAAGFMTAEELLMSDFGLQIP